MGAAGASFGHLTAEEAELLFRKVFGGVSLEQILQQALSQKAAFRWAGGVPPQRHEVFGHRTGARPSTSWLDDLELSELLRGFPGKFWQ